MTAEGKKAARSRTARHRGKQPSDGATLRPDRGARFVLLLLAIAAAAACELARASRTGGGVLRSGARRNRGVGGRLERREPGSSSSSLRTPRSVLVFSYQWLENLPMSMKGLNSEFAPFHLKIVSKLYEVLSMHLAKYHFTSY